MAFAFPDGNEAEDSSGSEDEARPAILSIGKLDNPKEAGSSQKNVNTAFFDKSPSSFQILNDEPSSALLREQIRDLRQDA